METMKSEHSISEMADALEVSASGYAEHLKKDERPRRREDEELGGKLESIFKSNREIYGLPRLQATLRRQGIRCGKARIARLQKRHGLHPVQKRGFRPQTTQSDPDRPVAPNWLGKMPNPDRPNQVWVGCIWPASSTCIRARPWAGTPDRPWKRNSWSGRGKKPGKADDPIPGSCTTPTEVASIRATRSEVF